MFGKLELKTFEACKLPQKAASAWSVLEELCGVSYKPLIYLGSQSVHGVSYYFIAERNYVTNPPIRQVVKLVIHELDGEYKLLNDSILEIA